MPVAQSHALCGTCWRTVHFIRPPLCDRLGIPLSYDTGGTMVSARAIADPPDFTRARAAGLHIGALKTIIAQFKYHDRLDIEPLLARLMIGAGGDLIADADLIVPVPLHWRRLASRKYNQAAMLAQRIGREANTPVDVTALVRHKPTAQQVNLTLAQRLKNPRGAFRVARGRRPLIDGRRVLLIDDVLTTGATASACARALHAAGAADVDVLAVSIARGEDVAHIDNEIPAELL
ncbi:MAG: ComF family protein, partial [Pseudomonadota bacterium]